MNARNLASFSKSCDVVISPGGRLRRPSSFCPCRAGLSQSRHRPIPCPLSPARTKEPPFCSRRPGGYHAHPIQGLFAWKLSLSQDKTHIHIHIYIYIEHHLTLPASEGKRGRSLAAAVSYTCTCATSSYPPCEGKRARRIRLSP